MDLPINILSLCSGVGGLDEGLRLALPAARVRCFVECEAACIAVLVQAMEEGRVDPAPVFTDVQRFDGRPYRGRVDILIGGFPCTPFSLAGKRRGTEDERHLWPHFARIIEEVQPRIVLCENVPGLQATRTLHHRQDITDYIASLDEFTAAQAHPVSQFAARLRRDWIYRRLLDAYGISALHYVLCDLERLGHRTDWELLSAEELGASQLRKRIWQ